MKIPYGICHFGTLRAEGFFYADKTPFLPVLESAESGYRHIVFLRPRRFGKSTLVSLLEHYYDLGRRDRFDELFRGLWIHEHPTAERNGYLVLSFDFSTVATDRGQDALLRTFLQAVRVGVAVLIAAHRARVPELAQLGDRLDTFQDPEALLSALIGVVRNSGHRLYVLIDEYDHFANRLLAEGAQDVYTSILARTGFVRTFYATLKAGTTSGTVARLFITGVSPLMLDDLSSGFNIVNNVSLDASLNALAGFTRADTERAVDEFLAARPGLAALPELSDRTALLGVLEEYYNGYRFSPEANERVFNSDMVLYFLSQIMRRQGFPRTMLDPNVRTEYGHLQRIGALSDTQAEERRALFQRILLEGGVESDVVAQFGVGGLSSEARFISLLYYLGMLTLGRPTTDGTTYSLEIPNRVILELQWEHLALMLKEQDHVTLDTRHLDLALRAMGTKGDIEPFLRLFHERVIQAIGLKDTRRLDEKTLKLMLMTYLSLSRMFHVLSEKEFAQGYCDLFLGASRSVPGAAFSWLLEIKYLKTGARAAQIEAAFAEAEAQVERYASDRALLPLLLGNRALKAGMLVFVGAKKVLFRPWDPRLTPPAPTARRAGSRPRARTPRRR